MGIRSRSGGIGKNDDSANEIRKSHRPAFGPSICFIILSRNFILNFSIFYFYLELRNAKIYGLVEQKHLENKEILRPEDLNFCVRSEERRVGKECRSRWS